MDKIPKPFTDTVCENKLKYTNDPHLALIFLLDTSGSMSSVIDIYVKSFNNCIENITKDYFANKRIDIAVIEFNDTVRLLQDFIPISMMQPITLSAGGCTAMGEGINLAIDKIKERIHIYKNFGTPCYRPCIVMITDGNPTDDIENAKQRLIEQEKNNKLSFFAIGAPAECNFRFLNELTNKSIVLDYKKYDEIFSWLFDGMRKISNSRIEETIEFSPLPSNSHIIDDWCF